MRFNIGDWESNTFMHCSDVNEYYLFCDYLHSVGKRWHTGSLYKNDACVRQIDKYLDVFSPINEIYLNFHDGFFTHRCLLDDKIIEFSDFEWGDPVVIDVDKATEILNM